MNEKKRLTLSQAKKVAKSYLTGVLGKEDVVEKDGFVCFRGPISEKDYMLTFEEGFDETNMLLTIKRIPVKREGVYGLDWIDKLYECTYMNFVIDFLVDDDDDDLVYPFFRYNYVFSTLNSTNNLEGILEKAAIKDVTMYEMVFGEVMRKYSEEDDDDDDYDDDDYDEEDNDEWTW